MTRALPELRSEILPHARWLSLGKRFPAQAVWFPLLLAGIIASSATVATLARESVGPAGILILLGLSVWIGLLYSSLALFTHELLHGSVIRMDRPLGNALCRGMAWFGFVIFGLSPELWTVWHNGIHHFNTNKPGVDPDSFGLWEDFKRYPVHQLALKRAPGSKHWLSYLHLPLNFSIQVVNLTWFFLWKGDQKLYSKVRKPRAVAEALSMYAFWALLWGMLGGFTLIWIFLIPALISNLILSGYILVQHLTCPLTHVNDPFENTLGVKGPEWIERIHFRFGYHVEHHLFPEANHSYYPKLRVLLRERYPERYRLLRHSDALRLVLATPRVYKDLGTLFDPGGSREFGVSTTGL